jgi:hypothetical protein
MTLTLAQATAKGWVVQNGPTSATPSGGPTTLVKECVLSGATISGRVPVTTGYHIGTGASADRSVKRVSEYAETQVVALARIEQWELRMQAIRDGIGYTEKPGHPQGGGTLD